jgi:XTP/dITP diphosphohydrolase
MRVLNNGRLVVATHNAGKMEEIEHLFGTFGVILSSAADHGLPEPAETEDSFVGNARIKAHAASRATGLPALADDSGLEVTALSGAPGVWTADWAETGNGRDFSMAMSRVWSDLEAKGAAEPRLARFCCTLVVAWPDGTDAVFEGFVDGRIIWPPRGDKGHGYDPIFLPAGGQETFGEMDRCEKNRMSHRAMAFRKLVDACFT